MKDIVLATLNARYTHCAFGLRYLMANMGELKARTEIREFEISCRALDVVESLLKGNPRIVGLGVYIWNAELSLEVARLLKALAPELVLVLGGPEISHEWESQELFSHADHIITGEADLAFAETCRKLLSGDPVPKVIMGGRVDPARLASPYDFYSDQDVQNRVLYVEVSRGCPFQCEFCLSSLENGVRTFPLAAFLSELERLLLRGARQFKFVDRTFNLSISTASEILSFFLRNVCEGMFLHFEMVPDRLPEELRGAIASFPPGVLQFEVGVQTFNPEVADRIHRRQNYRRLEENLRFLRCETGVHLHVDLIAGLPGETLESFASGFDRLVALDPQEIQVGILKRLRGTPITRHDAEWQMVYATTAPYELLKNRDVDFVTMQRIGRFSRYWDLVANSGNFVRTKALLWEGAGESPFFSFLRFSDWIYERSGRRAGISLTSLVEFLFEYLTKAGSVAAPRVAGTLLEDYRSAGRRDIPSVLRAFVNADLSPAPCGRHSSRALPKRQQRHAGRI